MLFIHPRARRLRSPGSGWGFSSEERKLAVTHGFPETFCIFYSSEDGEGGGINYARLAESYADIHSFTSAFTQASIIRSKRCPLAGFHCAPGAALSTLGATGHGPPSFPIRHMLSPLH